MSVIMLEDKVLKHFKERFNTRSYRTYTMKILADENEYYTDEAMHEIFTQTTLRNLNIVDFIKYKAGIIRNIKKGDIKQKKYLFQVDSKNEEQKLLLDKIKEKAKKINLKTSKYCEMKMIVLSFLYDIFDENELEHLTNKAQKQNMSLKEFLSNSIFAEPAINNEK